MQDYTGNTEVLTSISSDEALTCESSTSGFGKLNWFVKVYTHVTYVIWLLGGTTSHVAYLYTVANYS